MGLAYLPLVAVMNSSSGPVVNLYNAATASALTPEGKPVELTIDSDYPVTGTIRISISPQRPEKFSIRLRIPAWSLETDLTVNGKPVKADPGSFARIDRIWSAGDRIELSLDMRCRIMDAPRGSNRAGDHFQALVRGPVVLSRDENIDPGFNRPVSIISKDGYVDITPERVTLRHSRMQFLVPTTEGPIPMVDYASVDSWNGKQICTWLPKK
jgi:DUF1680 family protein